MISIYEYISYETNTNVYDDLTGFEATYQTVFTWSSFDVLESAIYRTALIQHNIVNGVLNSKAINDNLYLSQMPTPAGRVIFNPYGVNTNAQGLFLQSLPSSNTAEIVYPIQTRTASVVYPMPRYLYLSIHMIYIICTHIR
jgi:hypothetical protein